MKTTTKLYSLLLSFLLFMTMEGAPATQAMSLPDEIKVSLNLKDVSVKEFFDVLKAKSGFSFVYNSEQVKALGLITVSADREPMSSLLIRVLSKGGLTYKLNDRIVTVLSDKGKLKRILSGKIIDESGAPLIGVGVIISAVNRYVASDLAGNYKIEIPHNVAVEVRYSFVGMEPYIYKIAAGTTDVVHNVTLKSKTQLKEVVVTGIFTRSLGSFTGAASTIKSGDLQRVGNHNLIQSLKNIDPAIYIPDNLSMGSDPNALPDVSMRGVSSFPSTSPQDLKTQFRHNPNQPLFILDGFETSIETILDMDMSRIESVTILKDASAKALYGSKSANGVIVIETKKVSGSEQRLTYTSSLSFEIPDLTSYNLTNSLEKLEVELLDGAYSSEVFSEQERRMKIYTQRKRMALEGLDTYWLSKPLRMGIGHKHNVSVEVGSERDLRTALDFTYNSINGTMKGSNRTTYSVSVNTTYRRPNLLFKNIFTALSNKGTDSPYGSFATYAAMNPYWRAEDEQGNITRWIEPLRPNPLYDATIGTLKTSEYSELTENFFAEWQMAPSWVSTVRLGMSEKKTETNTFLPPLHSTFASTEGTKEERRGRYSLENGKFRLLSGDYNLRYSKAIGSHNLFANLGVFVSESKWSSYQHIAEGFSNNQIADITFARAYKDGSRPIGNASINREASGLLALSYDYDSRYLIDATFRRSASSLYGTNDRWANSWSIGAGWNLHNESWIKAWKALRMLKLRASVGLTGNQNFATNAAIATFKYYTGRLYAGLSGAYLTNMPNPNLKWEQKLDYNLGIDFRVSRLSLSADVYRADTHNMVTDLTIPTSTAFNVVKDNLGLVRNVGCEIKLHYTPIQTSNGYLSLYSSLAHNKNYIVRLSESLRAYNDKMKALSTKAQSTRPVALFEDGQSMTSIWAVPSAGIDPGTGSEIYIKQDGTYTYDYDPADLRSLGDSAPKIRGNAGFNAEYKGIGLSLVATYLAGGEMYNTTLVDKVENADITYNVDRRLAIGRWREVGQVTPYKKFDDTNLAIRTKPTSRFIQKRNELHLSSLSLYYEFPKDLCSKIYAERLRMTCYLNDLATFSSIHVERGTSYPFARRVSFSLIASF